MNIYNNRALKDVAYALNIKIENHHNALDDAKICARFFIEYLNSVDPDTLKYPPRKIKSEIVYIKDFDDRWISSEAKIQDLSIVENTDNPFYNKKIVISGTFNNFPIRNDLALLLKKYGADINTSISRKTDLFLTGSDWGSKKMEQVLLLQKEGYDILLMNELSLILELTKLNNK
jgi:DNA polymerase-3 subunit epsilon